MLVKDLTLSVMLKGRGILLNGANDPMKIMQGHSPLGEGASVDEKMNNFLGLADLYALLEQNALLISVIIILVTLIGMLFVDKQEKLAEKKQEIIKVLIIVFLISSLIAILNVLVIFFDAVFF